MRWSGKIDRLAREHVQLLRGGSQPLEVWQVWMKIEGRNALHEAAPIDVDVSTTFILYILDGTPRIVFQHEHEDFQQALRARGVFPL